MGHISLLASILLKTKVTMSTVGRIIISFSGNFRHLSTMERETPATAFLVLLHPKCAIGYIKENIPAAHVEKLRVTSVLMMIQPLGSSAQTTM